MDSVRFRWFGPLFSKLFLWVLSSITDFKISAVLNSKSKRSANGETIYLCIDRKGRHFINLNLEKTPKSAWSGKSLKLVNNQYQYVEFHNRVIAREIHHLKEIIQDFFKRSEILTADKLKNFYLVKYQGKSIKGVNGTIFRLQVIPLHPISNIHSNLMRLQRQRMIRGGLCHFK